MQRNKQADSHSSVHVHTVVPVNVPVDADDSEMEDGGGAAHDVTGHPCIAQQIPQQPQTIVHLHSILPPGASFNLFEPATEAEITTLIHASQNKQCDLDPIPTSLLKECADLLVPTITNIINLSLSTGTFPMQFKD